MDVRKPSRYVGGEVNSVYKDVAKIKVRFAFCFPDIYEVGMSCLGMQILYSLLNTDKYVWCERVFAPWPDMEKIMKDNGVKLFALESGDEIQNFDILGFTLQYELCYTNVLNMLKLADIPILSKDRKSLKNLVVAGGPCTYNPEPVADFIDIFLIGEGEELLPEVVNLYKDFKEKNGEKDNFLHEVAKIPGVYIPKFYDVDYNDDGTLKAFSPKFSDIPKVIEKRIINNVNDSFFPSKPVVPSTSAVHDRITYEIFRGCKRGCRFCQAGFICRPVREKSVEKISNDCKKIQENTGYDEISLSSLSSSDYSDLKGLIERMNRWALDKKVSVSLPSQRIDSFSEELAIGLMSVRKSGLTFAPEAGTQRLRDVINKNITEEMILQTCEIAFSHGWSRLKLYFMIGLPFETIYDVKGIAKLVEKISHLYRQVSKSRKRLTLTVSVSAFIPKPFTPFQWAAQDSIESINFKQNLLKSLIKNRNVKLSWSDANTSFIEAVFARGDRNLSKVLVEALNQDMKFDSWSEHFNFEKWVKVFKKCGVNPDFYANRSRDENEILPWEHISCGVTKKFFWREYKKAQLAKITPDCGKVCSACGLQSICDYSKRKANFETESKT